ncbi:MAG: DNA polymerase III subunit gamma/tau [Candidatus Pelagibacterales bacterium]|jgi:DNA polymerase-3 subunit gamma/tau|tara:strand:- start:1904 stop:3193 length:1290 start_codon:yes stop_codon:yes gene_type:complete
MDEQRHIPLPLKYRPNNFAELIGQELMAQTIKNAIKLNRIANAYLLTGVRGVGKTTTARIIAKALNCNEVTLGNSEFKEPCSKCDNCIAIGESRSIDVLEMDAASRTGISDIRELIDGVQYAPVSSNYKVYIIDEVHMLSNAAFNGLLKTLEEPPKHVKFIFATTEVRKIPATILSRCQRYDLKRIEPHELSDFFKSICDKEAVPIEDGALKIISRAAEGSVRDGLSLLDQAIAYSESNITEALVKDMIGLNDPIEILNLVSLLMEGQTLAALEKLNLLYEGGADPLLILRDLIHFVHYLTLFKVDAAESLKLSHTEAEFKAFEELATKLQVGTLSMVWQMLHKGLGEVSNTFSPISALEMLLIRIAYTADIPHPNELIEEISRIIEEDETLAVETTPAQKQSSVPKIDPKVQEIIDFFPGAEVETSDN